MNTQPEALRLADAYEATGLRGHIEAAAELRRLQYEVDAIPAIKEERDALQAELKATERQVEILSDALAESRKINAELLEALKDLFADYKSLADSGDAGFWRLEDTDEGKKALAAIAKHGGAA